ncbi:flagellar hook protein FlgE [Propylenella binzhouense]|uniref:Flagellar hook protein FlgE n=1 Tax=Propylenella binzhouense TaxID=2555902 RepID=A0A964T252_9HYPH|nr:flagellar hook protein FlgE [Propylenella binzhouense]MYZ46965.1 flagellar hook protein FlgE [Propylenella binzhouense]
MSLYTVMRAGVSGMAAQSNRLSAVADNIANSDTNGYKRAEAEFSSLVVRGAVEDYEAGGVTSSMTYAISEQGGFEYTNSSTDLAVNGSGFFVVSDASGNTYLTRAGSFVPDSEGNLVNAAGYYLMGYSLDAGDPAAVANGLTGLEMVNIDAGELVATPTTEGDLVVNLPVDAAEVAAGSLPSDNVEGSTYSAKTSLVAYDSVGGEVILDVYYTKTGENTWEVAVYDQADASAEGGFPYSSAPLSVETLTFDPATGQIAVGSASALSFAIPDGATVTIDLAGTTELSGDYALVEATLDGNAPSSVASVEVAADGTVYAVYDNGERKATYKIPLADVPSPDSLTPISGNVYQLSNESGDVVVGFPGLAGFGSVVSGALESSTVDLASELTAMIQAQRGYIANSKAFQTGADLLDVLVNLKR